MFKLRESRSCKYSSIISQTGEKLNCQNNLSFKIDDSEVALMSPLIIRLDKILFIAT